MPTTPHFLSRLGRCCALAAALQAPAAWAALNITGDQKIVVDSATGLQWDRCYLGQSAAYCDTMPSSNYTWADAQKKVAALNAQAGGYKGHNDWRLPNLKELASLVKMDVSSPAIDPAAFPGTPPLGNFWSSTSFAAMPTSAWFVNFEGGTTQASPKSNAYNVRLVRSGQSFAFFDAFPTPGMPTNVQATPVGNGGVTVTWTAPANTGGGITGYTVTAQPGGQTCTPVPATATTCTFTGLTLGQAYTFSVQASNGMGSSGPSAATSPVVPGSGAAAIPALGEWALALLAGLLGLFSIGALRRRG